MEAAAGGSRRRSHHNPRSKCHDFRDLAVVCQFARPTHKDCLASG